MISICVKCRWSKYSHHTRYICYTDYFKFSYVTGKYEGDDNRLVTCASKNPAGYCKDFQLKTNGTAPDVPPKDTPLNEVEFDPPSNRPSREN
jgi:hypothetical protein